MQWVTFYPSGHLRSVLVIGLTDRGSGCVSGALGAVAKRPCSGRVQSSESSLRTAMLKVGRSVFFKSWISFLLFLLCSFGALVTSTIGFIRMDFYYSLLFSGTTASLIDLSWPAGVQYDVLMITIDNEFQVAYKYGFILSYSLCFSSSLFLICMEHPSLTPLSLAD